MSCESCKEKKTQGDGMVSVPLVSVESERYYSKKSNTLLAFCLALVVCLLVGTLAFCYVINKDCVDKITAGNKDCMDKVEAINKYWIDFIREYDFSTYEYTQDGRGLNLIGDNNGVEYYGSEIEDSGAETEGRQGEGSYDATP